MYVRTLEGEIYEAKNKQGKKFHLKSFKNRESGEGEKASFGCSIRRHYIL